jgi:hypothetical protein
MAKDEQITKYVIPASVDELRAFVSDYMYLMYPSLSTHKDQLCLSYDQWLTQDFFSRGVAPGIFSGGGRFKKFSLGQRAERAVIWGR